MPTVISYGILCFLILEDWQMDFHMASWLPMVLAMVHMPGAPDLFDLDDTDEEVDIECLSLSNP